MQLNVDWIDPVLTPCTLSGCNAIEFFQIVLSEGMTYFTRVEGSNCIDIVLCPILS